MTRTKLWALALAALIGLGAFSVPQPAEAGRGWHGPGWRGGYWGPRRGYWGPRPWEAGLVGLGVGLAVGSALAAPPVYAAPPPVYGYDGYYDVPPPVAYEGEPYAPGPAAYADGPGGDDWYAYCASKYRSFNPQTGMYTGYDGIQRPCR